MRADSLESRTGKSVLSRERNSHSATCGRLVVMLAAVALSACSTRPLVTYATEEAPLVLVPASQAGVRDERPRIFEPKGEMDLEAVLAVSISGSIGIPQEDELPPASRSTSRGETKRCTRGELAAYSAERTGFETPDEDLRARSGQNEDQEAAASRETSWSAKSNLTNCRGPMT